MSVFKEVLPISNFIENAEYADDVEKADQNLAQAFVAQAAAILRQNIPDSDIEITTEVLKGAVDDALIEAAKAWEADIIVIGSHGRKFWERHIIGSICDKLVHHAPCSVFVVRPVD